GDMIYYTPGSHLLIALAGAWLHSDGLHVVHSVLTLTIALKCGLVFCVAARVLAVHRHRIAFAVAAVVLLFLPLEYILGSFARHSFGAKAVAELSPCAAWGAIVAWDDPPTSGAMVLFAFFAAATFVTWPIWIGPIVLTLAIVVAVRR